MVALILKQLIVFLLLIIIMLCSISLANLPATLQYYIMKDFKISITQYSLLFSIINWTALLDVLHGYLLDRYLDIRTATSMYCFLVMTGAVFFCIGSFRQSYLVLLIGRIFLGLGVNPLMICSSKHIIHWFSGGKCINMVFAVTESILWLGSSVCYVLTIVVFKSAEKYLPSSKALSFTLVSEVAVLSGLLIISSFTLSLLYGFISHQKISPVMSSNDDYRRSQISLNWKQYISISFFWIFTITTFIFFISVLSFLSMSQVYFETKYGVTSTYANSLSGQITLLAFFLSPLVGTLLDRFGQNLTCLTGAFILNILALGIFTFTSYDPLIPSSVMAVSVVLSSSMWSQFQYLVEDHQQMIAYAIAQTGLSAALGVGTLSAGYLITYYSYDGFIRFLFILVSCSIPLLIIIWILNYRRGNILNLNPKMKSEYLMRTNIINSS